jgi:hypothetical protein
MSPSAIGNRLGEMGSYIRTPSPVPSQKYVKKTFGEAIVAIPFKFIENQGIEGKTELYRMRPATIYGGKIYDYSSIELANARDLFIDPATNALYDGNVTLPSQLEDYKKLFPGNIFGDSYLARVNEPAYELLQKMNKYMLPPHLDFLRDTNIDPFVMYIFEFEQPLSTRDLKNIWQNIEPTFGKTATISESKVFEHIMPTTNDQKKAKDMTAFYQDGTGVDDTATGPNALYFWDVFDEDLTRWAVFKVKKRARNNYNNIIGRTLPIVGSTVNKAQVSLIRYGLPEDIRDYAYSYNWPHDFYSLVELAKISVSTTFEKRAVDIRKAKKEET